eukprot:COSAG01_NODE_3841_length_5646_cov_2.225527_1_plen_69_part_00
MQVCVVRSTGPEAYAFDACGSARTRSARLRNRDFGCPRVRAARGCATEILAAVDPVQRAGAQQGIWRQ